MDILVAVANSAELEYDRMCRATRRAFDELEALRSSFDTTGLQILRASRKHRRLLRARDALSMLLDDAASRV